MIIDMIIGLILIVLPLIKVIEDNTFDMNSASRPSHEIVDCPVKRSPEDGMFLTAMTVVFGVRS